MDMEWMDSSGFSDWMQDWMQSVFGIGNAADFQPANSPAVTAVCVILTLILTIVCYVVLLPHDKREDHEHSGSQAFFNFDRLIIGPVLKFVYLLLAIGGIVFCVAAIVQEIVTAIQFSNSAPLVFALFALVGIVVFEIVLRLVFELLIMLIKLVGDVDAIRGRMTAPKHADNFDGAPFYGQDPAAMPASAPAAAGFQPNPYYAPSEGMQYAPQYQRPQAQATTILPENIDVDVEPAGAQEDSTAVMPEVAQPATWDCVCGNTGISVNDKFCSRCGRPRP